MIHAIIFDADHTLLEFDEDEKRAFHAAFLKVGVCLSAEERTAFRNFSYELWEKTGLNDIHLPEIQKSYHSLYSRYVSELLFALCKRKGISSRAKEAEEEFYQNLSSPSHLVAGAKETLCSLNGRVRLFVATNGLTLLQRGRLSEIASFFEELFISEEVGFIKPQQEFFDEMLKKIRLPKQECLFVGDSLTSDIAGANAAGMKSCWLNRFHRKNESGYVPNFEISSLKEVEEVLKRAN